METTKISNKLTIAELGLTKDVLQAALADKKEGAEIIIARIFGKAAKYNAKPSKLDATRTDYQFIGAFEGVNMIDGTVVNAPRAYLPGAAEMATVAAIDGLGEGETVEFACEITVKKKQSAAVGYVFGVAVPKQPEAADPLASLRSQFGALPQAAATPAIEAPKAEKKGDAAKK